MIVENHIPSLFNMAVCYDTISKYESAIKYFKICIELKPEMAQAYFGAALANMKIGNYDISLTLVN